MKTQANYHFIVNPASRSGRGRLLWHELKPLLIKNKVNYRVFFTTGSDSARRYARHLTKTATDTVRIVVMGGDGTLNETINGLVNTDRVLLGYIPTGSSNDFARAHHFDKNIGSVLDLMLHSPSVPMDTGVMKTDDADKIQTSGAYSGMPEYSSAKNGKAFIVSTGIGYDAAVTSECNISPVKKLLNKFHLGKLAYLLIGIKHIFIRKTEDMTVTIDDHAPVTFKNVFFISVHNHPYEGGGFAFAPDAVPSDGLLDLCVIHGLNKLQLIPVLLASMKGKHTRFKGADTIRCRSVRVTCAVPQPMHADGESCGRHTGFEARVCPHSFNMLL